MTKSIEEQIRILADHVKEPVVTDIAVTPSRNRAFRGLITGASLTLVFGLVAGILLLRPGAPDGPSVATSPAPGSTTTPAVNEPPSPAEIPTVATRLVRDDSTDQWMVPVGTRDGVSEGLAVIDSDGGLVGLLGSPNADSTVVRVAGEPGFELDAFVAVPDQDAPDLSGTSTVEGTVRSTDVGSTVFVPAPGGGDIEIPLGSIVAASGGPDSPVHGKLPIGVVVAGDHRAAAYTVDIAGPVEAPVGIVMVRDEAD